MLVPAAQGFEVGVVKENFMRTFRFTLVALAVMAQALAQKAEQVTITEPGSYELSALYKRADAVALVEIVAGDTENYEKVVYKAKVETGFKGFHAGDVFYFGPFVGERLGTEYLLFLLDTHKEFSPTKPKATGYGSIHYWEVFNEGYSSMETSYECIFEATSACDYGVRVCTDYIKLPNSISAFPPASNDPPFGCRWVRKNVLNSALVGLTESNP